MVGLVVPSAGCLQTTGGPWDPYQLVDSSGEAVGPVTVYLRDLQAAGRTAATQRSYGMDLLRWFRFCWAIEAPWDQATRSEARDFCRWLQVAAKPGKKKDVEEFCAAHCRCRRRSREPAIGSRGG